MNVILWLEFKFAYEDVLFKYVTNYATGTPKIITINRFKADVKDSMILFLKSIFFINVKPN